MNPVKVVEYPSCRGVLDAFAFLVWKGGPVLCECGANTILQGRIDEETYRHHHQEGHDALRLFEIEGRGQKAGVFEEAEAAFGMHVAFVAGSHLLGRQLGVIQLIGGEEETTVLVDAVLPGRERAGQGPCDVVDHLRR